MKASVLLFALLALTACDKVVSTTAHPEQAHIVKSTQECSTGAGYCYACGMGSGGYKCSYGFKYSCPGDQRVTLRVTPTTTLYESGRTLEGESSETLSVDSDCAR